jgi:SGNH hydrolase-like domain, acetyltransferase AlgX
MSSSAAIPSPEKRLTAHQRASRGGPTDPSHDEDLRRGIIHTAISRKTAWLLAVAFLLVIYAVPVAQIAIDKANDDEIVLLDLFRRAPTKENLKQLEEDLDNNSTFRNWVQPRLQEVLSRYGRVGNKKAVIGQDGWLYYQPGVAFLGGQPFLGADTIEARQRAFRMEAGVEVHPDPRPAILAFAQALAPRGIKLVLFPVPDKAMLHPDKLHGRWSTNTPAPPPRNPDFDRWKRETEANGVAVFDATPSAIVPGEAHRYLVQDTHWTPAFMAATAKSLASFVRARVDLPNVATPTWRTQKEDVARVGDIVDMLKLPDGQTLFAPQRTTIEKVLNAEGAPYEPDAKADVLLLGDSFTNIFTQAPMGWGESAGLGPHLALALGRPVDVIAQNDAGAFATRQLLSRELAAGEDRLAGKRVVIWEFAARELGVGDWKPVTWPKEGGK